MMIEKRMSVTPNYDLDKIKFSLDEGTWQRAVILYEKHKVTKFESNMHGFSAVVLSSQAYRVRVSARRFDEGDCECYLGQNDELCKHIVAVALYALLGGKPLLEEEKQQNNEFSFSGKTGELAKNELLNIKTTVKVALRYIKVYDGPSRTWFAYQDSLSEGCNRLAAIVSKLPASLQTAELLVDILLRMDKKLCTGGVDDSDGTIGSCMEEIVKVLEEFSKADPECITAFHKLSGIETCFGWEDPLVAIFKLER
jgi:hypothetical protein